MITLPLLPYFLLSQSSVDVNSWFHGPKYTYGVHVSMAALDDSTGEKIRGYDIWNNLKCQTEFPDALSCRFEIIKMGFLNAGLSDLGQDVAEDLSMEEESFEMIFDKRGVRNLLVTKNMTPWAVNMIREISNQLNIGLDVKGLTIGEYNGKERSSLGVCESFIQVSKKSAGNDNLEWKESGFDIIPVFGFDLKYPGEILNITKIRDVDTCDGRKDYYFGKKDATVPDEISARIKSSVSSIIISDNNFTSFTTNEIIVNKSSTYTTLLEQITVTLDSLAPAKIERRPVPNAVNVKFPTAKS